MNEKVRQQLAAHNESNGWATDDATLIETLIWSPPLWDKLVATRRWWNEYRYVTRIGDMYIGFIYAYANRDESVHELGFEFDPGTICEMKPVEKVIIVYEPIEEEQ